MAEFSIENFGCRAARADGEAIAAHLRAAGHAPQAEDQAEVVVVNTCSVTAEADRAARAFIRRTHRRNPQAKIVVTGCYAQRAPEELTALEGVVAVVGNSHKALAPDLVAGLLAGHAIAAELVQIQPVPAQIAPAAELSDLSESSPAHALGAASAAVAPPQVAAEAASAPPQVVMVDDVFAHSFLVEEQVEPGAQTRPNLKIQEGCGNRCTFCVIPATRGPSRSLAAEAVLRQVEGFVAAGGYELVFSGINLGRWGRDLVTKQTLAGLVRRIFAETALPLLRLSSIEPMDWDEDLLALLAEEGGRRLARHAHLPLQSGSDGVLRRMHRRYRPWHYAAKIEALMRVAGPALTLGADVMVGFPGETEAEFAETVALIRALPFGYLHLFPFSPRPGTPGAALHAAAPVSAQVMDERMAALRALDAEKRHEHRRMFVGQRIDALTLRTPKDLGARGRTVALSENFLPIELEGEFPANQPVPVRVAGLTETGELVGTRDE